MHTKYSFVVASALALAFAASVLVPASARATFPGRNGLIAFSASVAGHRQIFVMNPDGSGQKQVTHDTDESAAPSISPDGKTIVFGTEADEIRAMTTTGADQRHLATAMCDWLSFSPDGRQILFHGPGQLWVMNADGSHQRRLTALGSATHVWWATYSPNGKTIVCVAVVFVSHPIPSPKDRGEILAMNADGTHLRRLAYTTPPGQITDAPTLGISFSPDGKKIVYSAYTSTSAVLRVMDANGSNQRLLPRSYGFSWPCCSPDGRQILCLNGHGQICVATTTGTHWRQLTHVSGGVEWAPNWGPHVR